MVAPSAEHAAVNQFVQQAIAICHASSCRKKLEIRQTPAGNALVFVPGAHFNWQRKLLSGGTSFSESRKVAASAYSSRFKNLAQRLLQDLAVEISST